MKRRFALLLVLCMMLSACGGGMDASEEQKALPDLPAETSVGETISDESVEPAEESGEAAAEASAQEEIAEESGDVSEEETIVQHFVASMEELEDYSGCWYQNRYLEDGNFEANWLTLTDEGEARLVVYSSELLDNKVDYQGNWIVDESGAVVVGMALCDGTEYVEGSKANFLWGRYEAEGGDSTLDMKWLEGDELWQGIREEPVTLRRTETRTGYMVLEEYSENKNMMVFSVNDVDLIVPGDTELIEKYGLTEDLDGYDYEIKDESEEYEIVKGFQDDCTFFIVDWKKGVPDPHYTDWRHFCKALLKDLKKEKEPRFVEYTVDADGFLVAAQERYLP